MKILSSFAYVFFLNNKIIIIEIKDMIRFFILLFKTDILFLRKIENDHNL